MQPPNDHQQPTKAGNPDQRVGSIQLRRPARYVVWTKILASLALITLGFTRIFVGHHASSPPEFTSEESAQIFQSINQQNKPKHGLTDAVATAQSQLPAMSRVPISRTVDIASLQPPCEAITSHPGEMVVEISPEGDVQDFEILRPSKIAWQLKLGESLENCHFTPIVNEQGKPIAVKAVPRPQR